MGRKCYRNQPPSLANATELPQPQDCSRPLDQLSTARAERIIDQCGDGKNAAHLTSLLFIHNYALSAEITRLAANQPPPPTASTTMSTSIAGNTLQISWPSNYVGSRLESNSVSLTTAGMWFTVSGSTSSNRMSMPINPSASNVFFRLAYP